MSSLVRIGHGLPEPPTPDLIEQEPPIGLLDGVIPFEDDAIVAMRCGHLDECRQA
jgi:hypothetical protein